MKVVCAAIGKLDLAVNDVGIGARGGAVEGPLEFAEGEGQATEGDVAVGARVAEALGFGFEVSRHLGEQIRSIEVEGLGEFQLEPAFVVAGKSEGKTCVG